MRKIVITLQLKGKMPKGEYRHIVKNVTEYIYKHSTTFLDGIEDAISSPDCLKDVDGIKKVTVKVAR